MYDDKGVMGCLFKGLFIRIMGNRFLGQPFVKGSDDCVFHGMFFQDVLDFGLGSAE